MAWYSFFDLHGSIVFSPKVTPNPLDAERLNKKLLQAAQKMDGTAPPALLRIVHSNESIRDLAQR